MKNTKDKMPHVCKPRKSEGCIQARTYKMVYLEYAEVRLLSRGVYMAIFRKGDVFEVTLKTGRIKRIVVK